MISKEKEEDFNMKLMHNLNIIEKKLDNESGSNKLGSHGSLDEKRRTRSVIKNHYHSSRHSNKRAHKRSSPSLFMKHKGSGVDELRG
jgi:hypothetical protein